MQRGQAFGNPMFGEDMSPSPSRGGDFNQAFTFSAATGAAAPASVAGLRRLGVMPQSQLERYADQQLSPGGSDDAMQEGEGDDGQQPPVGSLAGISPGGGAGSGGETSRERPEENDFAEVLSAAMRGEADAAAAVREYAAICRQRAASLRELASSQLQRAARYMSLNEQAEELEGEAASWQLLWFLHARPLRDFPAGSGGGFVHGAGFSKTSRQRAADLLFADATLNRCGRTVAWLEHLAGEALDSTHQAPLAAGDGVWADTRRRLDAAAANRGFAGRDAAALVSELDPDAPSRQHRALQADDAKDEERVMARIFRLLRAGRMTEARQLCEAVGQPWRAASLGGGGGVGPLPLGAAADEADAAEPSGEQAQDLASEVEGGAGLLRALWRWSCYQAAEQAGAAAEAGGAGLHEAAVYGALSGHLARILPVCASWEDCCWAYLRCWLDLSVDAALMREQGPAAGLEEAGLGAEGGLLEADVLTAVGSASAAATAQEGLAVMHGGWPVRRVQEALPLSFHEALQAAVSCRTAASTVGGTAAAAARHRRVQAALVLEQVQELVCDTLVQWITQGTGGGGDDDGAPACPPGLMRFGAHLALALWDLGIAPAAEGSASAAYNQLNDTLQRLLQVYIFHLIDTGAHRLVPLYACHLRAGLRHTTYQIFFNQLLEQASMEECRVAYRTAADWFAFWGRGDMTEAEAVVIAQQVAQHSRQEVGGGPLLRAQSARWLCFDTAGASGPAALLHANTLCREFALGTTGGVAAATVLLTEVLPAALGGSLEDFAAAMEASEDVAVAVEAAELRSWAAYFDLESEFAAWQQLYQEVQQALQHAEAAGDAAGAAAAQQSLTQLAADTAPLLHGMLHFLRSSGLDCLAGAGSQVAGGQLVVTLAPDSGIESAAEVLQGSAFPSFSGPEEQQEVAEALGAALAACAAAFLPADVAQQLQLGVGPSPDDMPGLVRVDMLCGSSDALEGASLLLAQALKGNLPTAEGLASGQPAAALPPLVVVQVTAPPAASAALCRHICYPRLALKCAALREALAFMGDGGTDGDDLVVMVASREMAPLFSSVELMDLLQYERAAAVLQQRIAEQQGEAEQPEEEEQQQQQQQAGTEAPAAGGDPGP